MIRRLPLRRYTRHDRASKACLRITLLACGHRTKRARTPSEHGSLCKLARVNANMLWCWPHSEIGNIHVSTEVSILPRPTCSGS